MEKKYLLALDQGTTSSRTVVFDFSGNVVASHGIEFPQIYPQPGWVEHDPKDILDTQIESIRMAVKKAAIGVEEIAAIGITNQRETTVVWDRKSGETIGNAIVWQCRRTAPYVEELKKQGYDKTIQEKTGLVPDAYFSGTKITWILDQYNLHEQAQSGRLCFGTIDSFLAWNLVEGRPHVTDATNASRTMIYNIHTQKWDEELLSLMKVPKEMLPEVVDTSQIIGMLDTGILGKPIPVAAMAGDQHASLFGQDCTGAGMVKNTYGTGCFMLMNTGDKPIASKNGLLATTAWRINGKPTYALEGSVFMGGATIQWLRDELQLIQTSAESENVAKQVEDTGGVYLVPAFTGLGAPWWDMYSRGTIVGLTRGSGRAHIVRAALEAIAYQSNDLLTAMIEDWGEKPRVLQVDGGASNNGFLMQFQSDIMNTLVVRPKVMETTALGAALFAGLAVGVYESIESISSVWQQDLRFEPSMEEKERENLLKGWHKAVKRSLKWIEEN